MKTQRETFRKSEKLCSRKIITLLFEEGNIFYLPMYKIVWKKGPLPEPVPAQVAFSVPKKIFRLAVTRNLIKRRLREAYRKNKHQLYSFLASENITVAFIVILRDNSVPSYKEVEISTNSMILRLIEEIKKYETVR